MNLQEFIQKARKQANAVYLACEPSVADDISKSLVTLLKIIELQGEAIERMKNVAPQGVRFTMVKETQSEISKLLEDLNGKA